jgi:maltooligosyltrehalose trehalohydrolase
MEESPPLNSPCRLHDEATVQRRYAIGAETGASGVHVRVWADAHDRVELVFREAGTKRALGSSELQPDGGGYFAAAVRGLRPGSLYSFRLDGDELLLPDPASRFQPEGPHGPSQVIDPAFAWTDGGWRGVERRGQVIYEMHVGTFTPEGTCAAAAEQLPELARLGITVVELMPLADFPGRFGWGYDGVSLWAPTRLYGTPDDLRRFVDRAHASGVGVILDVVYNHLGPDGNYLGRFSSEYFTDRYQNEWGEAINFDGPGAAPVREFFVENAGYWIEEFHLDGLRLDATQQIFDASPRHLVAEVAARVRQAAAAAGRSAYISVENEPQDPRCVRSPERGGYGCDALWNDDFHHSARVALTGRNEAYYSDYLGTPRELVSATRWGYLFQGQHSHWQRKRRGEASLDLEATQFVSFLENHDQVANSLRGARLHELTSPARLRALTALLLLSPQTPMLFQGQEFASSAPFLFFADHEPRLARLVSRGRREFLAQFPSIRQAVESDPEIVPDASSEVTFRHCTLDLGERERHAAVYALHGDLLRLRREDPAIRQQRSDRLHGAVLTEHAFVLRFLCGSGDRLLVVNLGADCALAPAPEPLLAPPEGADWREQWSSENPRYGGSGSGSACEDGRWRLPAESALLFAAAPANPRERPRATDGR